MVAVAMTIMTMTIINETVDEMRGCCFVVHVSWALHVCGAPNFSELVFSQFKP